MFSETICKKMGFQLQNVLFEADLRVMEIPGQDIVLGIDWLSRFGRMEVDWKKGEMAIKYKGKIIELGNTEIQAKV